MSNASTASMLAFEIADSLLALNPAMTQPRDLPGRYGRVVRDLERLLIATETLAVVAGGWAVWRHGFAGRVTEDVDIVVEHEKITALRELASTFGFQFLEPPAGRWPKLIHKTTSIDVDLLPEAGVPGTAKRLAPVAIRHPDHYDAVAGSLAFITLAGLIELKLGAGRAKDTADIVELIKRHPTEIATLRSTLAEIHGSYAIRFDELVDQASEE